MITSRMFKNGVLFSLLILVLLFSTTALLVAAESQHGFAGGKRAKKITILLFDHTPEQVVKGVQEAFPDYRVQLVKERPLARFLSGCEATPAYDVQALPLMESGVEFCFYPLYTDIVIISIDRSQVSIPVTGWEDLKSVPYAVSFPWNDPELRYIWASISYAYTETFEYDAASNFLAQLKKQDRLLWDEPNAPIQILLASAAFNKMQAGKDMETVIPKEGTLSFEAGILSRDPIHEEKIADIKEIYRHLRYPLAENTLLKTVHIKEGTNIQSAAAVLENFISFNDIKASLHREVLGIRKHVPADGREHQLCGLLLIVLIVIWSVHVQKQVIHFGIRRGLLLTGFLLIGWISLGLFKYAFYREPLIIRACWYLYYAFILPLPVLSLYIAENADRPGEGHISVVLIICSILSVIFILLVLTNDLHRFIFQFNSPDPKRWNTEYTYGIGHIMISIWFILSQFGAFLLMLKKGRDYPKRKVAFFPLIMFLSGILCSIMYSRGEPFFREIPLVLGMSSLVIGFWTSAILSGLIPSNRGYRILFESSSMDMQILDREGNMRYRSEGATPLPNEVQEKTILVKTQFYLPEKDTLIWATPINGGTVIIKENIRILSQLRYSLQEVTQKLEDENHILLKKEQVQSRLILMKEQNRLIGEVNRTLHDKIKRMHNLLEELNKGPLLREKTFNRINRLAIHCKRSCELLIKSKQQSIFSARDLCRLMQEATSMMPEGFTFFSRIESPIPFYFAILLYDYYHLVIDVAYKIGIPSMNVRLYRENKKIYMYLIAEGETENLFSELQKSAINNSALEITKKDLGDATSITIQVQEGELGHA